MISIKERPGPFVVDLNLRLIVALGMTVKTASLRTLLLLNLNE